MTRRRSAAHSLLVALLAAPVLDVSVFAGGRPIAVEFADGKLSVDFDDVPLPDAFHAIEAKAGVQIKTPPSTREKRVTVSFREMPVERGVREVLRKLSLESHAVLYDSKTGAPRTFVVVESSGPGGSRPPSVAEPNPPIESRLLAPPVPGPATDDRENDREDEDEDEDEEDE